MGLTSKLEGVSRRAWFGGTPVGLLWSTGVLRRRRCLAYGTGAVSLLLLFRNSWKQRRYVFLDRVLRPRPICSVTSQGTLKGTSGR